MAEKTVFLFASSDGCGGLDSGSYSALHDKTGKNIYSR